MKKEKLINEIDVTIESIRMHVKRFKSDGNEVHKIDIDLLIEKTRELYDKLIKLEGITMPFETATAEESKLEMEEQITEEIMNEEVSAEETVDESFKEDEMPKGMIEPEEQEEETLVREDEKEESFNEIHEQDEPKEQEVETVINVLKNDMPDEKSEEHVKFASEDSSEIEEVTEEREALPKSTIDLFSTSAEPTLGDRLKGIEQPTIADKINKNTINELREAIGINEKFLFINELFNGDMSRYNRIIDELDGLSTIEGVNTYMLELKIQNQWRDDNAALIKLTELLQRKFIK